jgi:hypothetical protein
LPIDFSFERIAITSKQIWSRFFLIRMRVCPDPAYVFPYPFQLRAGRGQVEADAAQVFLIRRSSGLIAPMKVYFDPYLRIH